MILEEWRPIKEFPTYAVSNYGHVQNMQSGRMLMRSPVQTGQLTVAMTHHGQQFRRSISTLVAEAFLPAPESTHFNTPIHLDGDKNNCQADNLAWRPRWFAILYHMERRAEPFSSWTREFRLVDTGEVFDDLREVAVKYGILKRDIHTSLVNGTQVFPFGFTFVYLDE